MKEMESNDSVVLIRSLDMRDAELLMDLNNDPETAKYVVGNPQPVTLQQQLEWMERVKDEKNTKRFIVEYLEKPVGTIIISAIDLKNLTGNLNIKLQRSSRGRGIGKQSIKLALEFCFERLGLYCVTAHVLSYNEASLALFERCGFVREGVMRSRVIKNNQRQDLISFSITRKDFYKIIDVR